MRKFLLMSSALVAGGLLSGSVAEAACIQTPTCSSLGYTSTASCTGGVKCPFGNAWNCTSINKIIELEKTIEELQTKIIAMNCKVGDILFADMTCGENNYPDKTPIGVVFDAAKGLAIAKDEFANLMWGMSGDILGIQNYSSASASNGDWQGFKNTKSIYDYEKSQNGYYPAMEKVLLYSTAGTSQGQWYLPAAGELKVISDNKNTLNTTLSIIGGTQLSGSYWSSSEKDGGNVWQINLEGSLNNTPKSNRAKAKPIVNFVSKDKISVDLNKSTACKVGDILYSDKTCSANVVSGKTPIGVVFNGTNRLAIALESSSSKRYWGSYASIPGLSYIRDEIQAEQDFNGKANTAAIKAYDSSLSSYPVAGYAYEYKTTGTKAGDWYLPAVGELNEIYQNKITIIKTLSALGQSTSNLYNTHWSSSVYTDEHAWTLDFNNGDMDYYKNKGGSYGYVLPVLAF